MEIITDIVEFSSEEVANECGEIITDIVEFSSEEI